VRILVLASTFPRWTGDTLPPFVYHLSSGLAARGHDIHVLAPHAAGAARNEEMNGLRVHRFRYGPEAIESLAYEGGILENLRRDRKRWALVPPFMASQFAAMVRIVRHHEIEAIHAHWMLPQGLVSAVGRRLLGCPVVMSAHGGDVYAMKKGLRRRLLSLTARRADVCTAVSTVLQAELRRLTGVEATVIPMGVDPSAFEPRPTPRHEGRARDPNGPRILFVGRLAQKKGVTHLIQAMAVVRSANPGAGLVVVGDGPERQALETLATTLGGGVEFVGPVPNTELPAYYQAGDIFMLPSVVSSEGDTEGLPVVLMEAAASELPIVASRVGGIPDLVQHERTGLLVEPGDPGAIATAVNRLLADEGLRRSLGEGARRAVVERFSWAGVVDRFDAVFRSLPRAG
jgi:glycosyltransferase involved in cell wall biosynthesis